VLVMPNPYTFSWPSDLDKSSSRVICSAIHGNLSKLEILFFLKKRTCRSVHFIVGLYFHVYQSLSISRVFSSCQLVELSVLSLSQQITFAFTVRTLKQRMILSDSANSYFCHRTHLPVTNPGGIWLVNGCMFLVWLVMFDRAIHRIWLKPKLFRVVSLGTKISLWC
jgi:hypothetical protein